MSITQVGFVTVGTIPERVVAKARTLLGQRPRKLVGGRGTVIEVGLRYRLFSPRGSSLFQLMTHERYNKVAAKDRNH